MKAIYARLIKLLGQPPDGEIFKQFVAELGDQPTIDPARYTFHMLGVTLVVTDEQFSAILIEIDSPAVRQGIVCRYEADLPNAIDRDDAPEVIEKKLGISPFSSNRPSVTGLRHEYFQDSYKLPPLVLVFEFTTGPERLSSVAIGTSDA
jgi:hypothetical protein